MATRCARWPVVNEAETIADGIEALNSRQPDLIVTEVRFKDGDASRLLDAIRALPSPRPHVVVLTADVFLASAEADRLTRAGVDQVATKPITVDHVVSILDTITAPH